MTEWLKFIIAQHAWYLPIGTYFAGILTKPLQEEMSRRITLYNTTRTARRNMYKELAWNVRLLFNDSWLTNHAISAHDIQTSEYDKASQNGMIHELKEGAEIRDCMEFFKAFRALGLGGSTSHDAILTMVGDALILGLNYALIEENLSVTLLKKVSRKKEQNLIDTMADEYLAMKGRQSQAYLAKHKK